MTTPKKPKNLARIAVITGFVTIVCAIGGGYLGIWLMQAPFYFGFWFALVLVGLIGLFVLASVTTDFNRHNR